MNSIQRLDIAFLTAMQVHTQTNTETCSSPGMVLSSSWIGPPATCSKSDGYVNAEYFTSAPSYGCAAPCADENCLAPGSALVDTSTAVCPATGLNTSAVISNAVPGIGGMSLVALSLSKIVPYLLDETQAQSATSGRALLGTPAAGDMFALFQWPLGAAPAIGKMGLNLLPLVDITACKDSNNPTSGCLGELGAFYLARIPNIFQVTDVIAELEKPRTSAYGLAAIAVHNPSTWGTDLENVPADVDTFQKDYGIPVIALQTAGSASGASVRVHVVGPQDGRLNIVEPPGRPAKVSRKRDSDGKLKLDAWPGLGTQRRLGRFSCRAWSEPWAKIASPGTSVIEIGRHYADDVVKVRCHVLMCKISVGSHVLP